MNPYAEEAKARWGDTEAYKQSTQRTQSMTKADFAAVAEKNEALMKEIVSHMADGAESASIQSLIGQHYENLRTFYDPNPELYRGLADMYVNDPRFTAYYEKYAEGLAVFMHNAMHHYADSLEQN